MASNKRFSIIFTSALLLAVFFAWIRQPAAVAVEAPKAPPSSPFDGAIVMNTQTTQLAASVDAQAAERGKILFNAKANCATCHVPPFFTEPGWNLHTGAEIGIDDFQANRAPVRRYRTPPLKGLFAHAKGGFFHDGRFATLRDVVDHYDSFFKLSLSEAEKKDLIDYLKSL